MEKEQKDDQAKQHFSGIYGHLLKARKEAAVVFPHSSKVYKAFVGNYQGVRLSKKAVQALGKI